jgi:hypothetical protein
MSVMLYGRIRATSRQPMRMREGVCVMANKATEAVAIVEHPNLMRIELIDDTGRVYIRRGVSVTLSYQDDGRTLKVFVKGRAKKND